MSCDEVRKMIATVPSNKAPGYGKVPMSVIKDCLEHILPVITKLVNNSFNQSVFPKAWKKGEVVPLLKEGGHEVPNNNRPICLLPVLSKVAEKLAYSQLNHHLLQKKRLTCHQSGNRKHHSTETLSLLVTNYIFKAIDNKQVTVMVLIDLSKAFDSICHRRLLCKIQQLGISDNALHWFQS